MMACRTSWLPRLDNDLKLRIIQQLHTVEKCDLPTSAVYCTTTCAALSVPDTQALHDFQMLDVAKLYHRQKRIPLLQAEAGAGLP